MCIFCKIINHEIPSYTIYEDDQVLAFLDISQVTKGHTLVVPKKHFDKFVDCDDETCAHLMLVTKKLTTEICHKTKAVGYNILTNGNEVAGQSVMHAHVHIIPRYSENDDAIIQFKEHPQTIDLEQLAQTLKSK